MTSKEVPKEVKYTFVYCQMHDDGCLIKGQHEYVPEGYKMAHSDKCANCDWYVEGVISYDGINIKILEDIRIDFSRYGGEYYFHMYASAITDELGNTIILDEDSDIFQWIESVAEYAKSSPDTFIF
uniref:Uncharacterized protein n=1 Tax=viral metagenome TaxID=1070528 RepID=A0A6C0IHZ2_9ZZZZ